VGSVRPDKICVYVTEIIVSLHRNNTENVSVFYSISACKRSTPLSQLHRMVTTASTGDSQHLQQCPHRRNDKPGEMYLCYSNKMQVEGRQFSLNDRQTQMQIQSNISRRRKDVCVCVFVWSFGHIVIRTGG
jgi:hypothetical protein